MSLMRVVVYFRGPKLSLENGKKDLALIKYDIAETLQLFRPSNTRDQRFKSFFVDRVCSMEGKLFAKIERVVMVARKAPVNPQLVNDYLDWAWSHATLPGALYRLEAYTGGDGKFLVKRGFVHMVSLNEHDLFCE
ncbi:hypothetical protein G9A89_007556 [Geosiphon pyriformis]|nr:hypothetical protein G9A89_007556 [Geosiphon pyriformis]